MCQTFIQINKKNNQERKTFHNSCPQFNNHYDNYFSGFKNSIDHFFSLGENNM